MADIAHPVAAADRAEPQPSGPVTFPELVYAHFEWRRGTAGAEDRYRATLRAFEDQNGPIVNSYWCSAVFDNGSVRALSPSPRGTYSAWSMLAHATGTRRRPRKA
jgi:hypothetical protein